MAAASGCSLARSTLPARRSASLSVKPSAGDHGDHLRFAFGQGAGLVDDERVDLFHPLQRFGVLDQDAGVGAAADADHDRHRRREAERARAGDDQHADRGDEAEGEARLGSERRPGGERRERGDDDERHEPRRHLIGEPLDRRARALRRRDHLHDPGEQRVAADLFRADDESAGLIERAADQLCAGALGDRHRLAGDHRFIERRAALDHHAVDRNLFARPHPQPVADGDQIERDFLFAAVVLQAPRGFGREVEERADGAGGLLARTQFQNLAEQHQHGDDGGRLEIDRDGAAMAAERRRENAGREQADDAVDPGDAGAERDQREHVEIARLQRLRAAHEERPAGPEDDRRRQHELDPLRHGLADRVQAGQMSAHFQRDDRNGEREPDPEPAAHVGEFRIGRGLRRHRLRLERHAADRAGAGAGLADFGMHRAGVDGAVGHRKRGRRCWSRLGVGRRRCGRFV